MGHWTQTSSGKKKLAAAMRKNWKKRKNGHVNGALVVEQKKSTKKSKLTRNTIVNLAKEGARTRLRALEAEAETLRIFLGDVS
jgi:hypothetical protein